MGKVPGRAYRDPPGAESWRLPMNIQPLSKTLAMLALGAFVLVPASLLAATKDEMRAEQRKVSAETLQKLYSVQPKAKAAIDKAAGYATFSNFGMKIMVAGSGSGKGIAVNKKGGKETFMKMIEVQAGLGFGIKKFRVIWVFSSEAALNNFISSGWEAGGQASAGAKAGGKGDAYQGAIAVSPGVWIYQLTDKGVALELTAKGTKYYKDDDLN
jgi:lipid-binding SYLF domain-containing protein